MLALAAASPASAHPPPRATDVARSADGAHLAIRLERGLVVSRDAGASWQLRCAEAAGFGAGSRPAMAWAGDELLLATPQGLHVDAAGCDRRPAWPELDGVAVSALVEDGAGGFWAATSQAGVENGLWRSPDGRTWAREGAELRDIFLSGLAPAGASRLYATAVRLGDDGAVEHLVRRSDDAGGAWVDTPIALSDQEHQLRLLGSLPGAPDVLLVAAQSYDSQQTTDRLLRSDDAGASFEDVARLEGVAAFAGEHLATAQGLMRTADAGLTFTPVPGQDRPLGCVRAVDDGLLLCGEHLLDHFALALLRPDSDAVQTLLEWDAVTGPVECGDGVCDEDWQDWIAELPPPEPEPEDSPSGGGGDEGCASSSAGPWRLPPPRR